MFLNELCEGIDRSQAVNGVVKLIRDRGIEFKTYEDLQKFIYNLNFLKPHRNDTQYMSDVVRFVLRKIHDGKITESSGTVMMGKIARTGKIVRIIRKQHSVKFSNDKDWLLIDTDPAQGNRGQGLKWIPASTDFEWVRPYLEKIDEEKIKDHTKHYQGLDLNVFGTDTWLQINAMSHDRRLGRVLFVKDGNTLEAQDLDVEPKYRGQGVAQVMYDYAKKLGYQIKRSSQQTDAGKGFWDKHQGADTTVWEEELDEGVREWLAGVATVGAMLFGAPDANAITQQQYNQTAQMLATAPAQVLKKVAVASGITGHELAQLMAQCAHETAGFSTMREHGGTLDFRKYDIRHNPRKAKALGNLQPGDGARYHGRGFIQLTGRDNYRRAGQALGLPLEQRPELVERPDVAAKVAVWFWKNQVKPKVSSYQDTAQVTRPINPAMRGLSDREAKFQAIKQGAMARAGQLAPRGTKI